MGRINMGRVILGGLLAGLVINIGESVLNIAIIGAQFETALQDLDRQPPGGQVIALFVLMGFAMGIAMVWLYAAMRPRFGPGPKTAAIAGLVVWLFGYLFPSAGYIPLDLFPVSLYVIAIVWGLFEVPIAAVAGAWLYKEE